MTDSLLISTLILTDPAVLFHDWLDSVSHSLFTGTTLELTPGEKIVQSWRTSEFPAFSPDSLLTVTFESVKSGPQITIDHKNIPAGQGDNYKKGWRDYYFSPMNEYYSGAAASGE